MFFYRIGLSNEMKFAVLFIIYTHTQIIEVIQFKYSRILRKKTTKKTKKIITEKK